MKKMKKEFIVISVGNEFVQIVDFTQNNFDIKYKDNENQPWKSTHIWIEEREVEKK